MSKHDSGRPEVFTIGHSNHAIETFLGLLRGAGIGAVADVRSMPYSRRHPQFRKEALQRSLAAAGIAYVFLGDALGARPSDPACYVDGRVVYDRIAATEAFRHGLERVEEGARRYRVALMCAEKEPLDCHRTLLVARHLMRRGTPIRHILADGTVEAGETTERRLIDRVGPGPADLFAASLSERERIDEAYRRREARM